MGLTDRITIAWRMLTMREWPGISLDEWASYFAWDGAGFPLIQTLTSRIETPDGSYNSLVSQAYKSNGVVFACILARLMLFSEARFQFRQRQAGRPGDLFGNETLRVLEHPWPNATTGDLLARAIQDADLAGNFYGARRPGRIKRLRPDWVSIILGSDDASGELEPWDIDAEVAGIVYFPGGRESGEPPVSLLPGQFCHFAPIPDPQALARGMSWLTPVIREVAADSAATRHKAKFFENGATPNMVVRLDKAIGTQAFRDWVEMFRKDSPEGVAKAYKTLYLGGGADVTVVGSDLKQLDFRATQGAGETRIAAAAGVPPVIVGLSEGLQAATYSNYGQARRRFADGTMRPLWRNFAGSMEAILPPPAGAELWYDDRDIPFLAEDQKDAAEVQQLNAAAIRTLVDAGFEADSVIQAVTSRDLSRLVHTGLFSVQLQPPGTTAPAAEQAGRAIAALIAPHLNGSSTP